MPRESNMSGAGSDSNPGPATELTLPSPGLQTDSSEDAQPASKLLSEIDSNTTWAWVATWRAQQRMVRPATLRKPRAPAMTTTSRRRAGMSDHGRAMDAAIRVVEGRRPRLGIVREPKEVIAAAAAAAAAANSSVEGNDPASYNYVPATTTLEQRRQRAKAWAESRSHPVYSISDVDWGEEEERMEGGERGFVEDLDEASLSKGELLRRHAGRNAFNDDEEDDSDASFEIDLRVGGTHGVSPGSAWSTMSSHSRLSTPPRLTLPYKARAASYYATSSSASNAEMRNDAGSSSGSTLSSDDSEVPTPQWPTQRISPEQKSAAKSQAAAAAVIDIASILRNAESHSWTLDDLEASLASVSVTSPPDPSRVGVRPAVRFPSNSGGSRPALANESHTLRQAANFSGLRELAKMAGLLQEVASNWAEDKETQLKELSLEQDSFDHAYFFTVRDGLCSSYFAASVIASDMVTASKTGAMGTAGKALNVVAGVAPIFPGLKTLATALKEGDRILQTQGIKKITEMAGDVVECCALAKRLALRLTEALAGGACPAQRSRESVPSMSVDGSAQRAGFVPPGADVEDVEDGMEWLVEEVLGNHPASRGDESTSSAKEGRRTGKSHLKMLLKAVGRGCVRGEHGIDAKVDILARVVLPGIERRAAASAPQDANSAHPALNLSGLVTLRPVVGLGAVESDARVLDPAEQMKALEAGHEALNATNAKLAGTNAALIAKNDELADQNADLADQNLDLADQNAHLADQNVDLADRNAHLADQNADLADQNAKIANKLEAKVKLLDEHIERASESVDRVAGGRGQIFRQRAAVAQTMDDGFWDRAQESASHHPVTQCQLEELKAVFIERIREVELSQHWRAVGAEELNRNWLLDLWDFFAGRLRPSTAEEVC